MQQRVSNVSNPESYAIFNDSLPLDLVHSRTSVVLSPLVVCSLRLVVSTVKSFAPFHVLKRDSFRKVSPRASDNYFGASIRGYSTRAIRLSYLIVSRLDTRLVYGLQALRSARIERWKCWNGDSFREISPRATGTLCFKQLFRGLYLRVFYLSNTRISYYFMALGYSARLTNCCLNH